MGQTESRPVVRSAFIITRPMIESDGVVGWLGKNDPSVQHWALVLTKYDEPEIKQMWEAQSTIPWGTLFESGGGDNGRTIVSTTEGFRATKQGKWLIHYVGQTTRTDEEVEEEGEAMS
jgi:hypothetical protein